MSLRDLPGFLGTDAHFLADITLITYLLLLLPLMIIGYRYARQQRYVPHHKFTMTAVTLLNVLLIGGVMIASYTQAEAPNVAANAQSGMISLPTLHLIIGGAAQLLAMYLVLRMWLEDILPAWMQVQNIKFYMRLTLLGWVTAALMGIGIYVLWYVVPPPVITEEAVPVPIATEDAVSSPTATEEEIVPAPVATEDAVSLPAATEETVPVPIATEDAVSSPAATEEIVPAPAATEDNTNQRTTNREQIEQLEARLEQLEDRAKDRDDETLEARADALLDQLNDLDARDPDFDSRFAELEFQVNQLASDF